MRPKVSICVIAYNHEKYIEEAIKGFLLQKTDFDYEIIIGEDSSTDKTREIVLMYAKKYPNKFKLLLPDKNQGMMRNLINTYNACRGEYVALCEGDDYWTDPYKLQKQVDFLDRNIGYSICSHGVDVVCQDASRLNQKWIRKWIKKGEATIEDIISFGGAATCSLLFRNRVFGGLPKWFEDQRGGDLSLQILCADKGKMKYFSDIMGVYRIHDEGAWSARVKEARENNIDIISYHYRNMEKLVDALDNHLSNKYSKLFDIQRRKNIWDAFSGYFFYGDYEKSKKILYKLVPNFFHFSIKIKIKMLIKMFVILFFSKKISLIVLNYNKKRHLNS